MHFVICLTIIITTTMGFARVTLGAPSVTLLVPELISAFVAIVFLNQLAVNRQLQISSKYLVLFGLLLITLIAGLFVAEATTGPIVGGIRVYLKYVPFFLLALVYPFTERQLEIQLKLLLFIAVMQFPFAFAQRFIIYANTGDWARGTFRTSSMAATFLFSSLAVLLGFYLKGKISKGPALLLAIPIFLTPNISEVKSAVVLIPLALLAPFAIAPSKMGTGKKLATAMVVGTVTLALFATIYGLVESKYRPRADLEHRTSLVAFFTNPEVVLNYLAPKLSGGPNSERIGRVDALAEPIVFFMDDPMRMLTGLGFGALAEGPIEAFSSDQHATIQERKGLSSSWVNLLWEFGLLGTLLVLIALGMVWRDAYTLRKESNMFGAIGIGWTGVVAVMVFAMAWKNVMQNGGIMVAFAYWSGIVVAARYRLTHKGSSDLIESPTDRANRNSRSRATFDYDDNHPADSQLPPILNEVR